MRANSSHKNAKITPLSLGFTSPTSRLSAAAVSKSPDATIFLADAFSYFIYKINFSGKLKDNFIDALLILGGRIVRFDDTVKSFGGRIAVVGDTTHGNFNIYISLITNIFLINK